MSWYYAEGQVQRGPVDEGEFQRLRTEGRITEQTLVWKDGMDGWKPLKEAGAPVLASGGGGFGGATAMAVSAGAEALSAGAEVEMATCAHSGKTMPRSQMIKYGDAYVAPEHKDAFVQSLKEGGDVSALQFRFAGFWIRVAAKLIDGILLNIVTGIPYYLVYFKFIALSAQENPDPAELQTLTILMLAMYALMFALQIAYATFMVGKYGATLGKMAVGIKVINPDGSKVSYLKAFARWWAELLSGMIMGIGYLMVAFDDQKRALHDHICGTRVVKK